MEPIVGIILVFILVGAVICVGNYEDRRNRKKSVEEYEKTKHITETVTATIQLMDGNSLSFMETFYTTFEKAYPEGYNYVSSAERKASNFKGRLERSYINGIKHEGIFYTPAAIASVKID